MKMTGVQNPALESKKRQLLQTGMQQLSEADVTDAIKTFGEVIKLDPTDTRGYFVLVQTYIRLQNFENASNVLDTIIKLDPENGQAFYLKAITSGFLGQKDIAMVAAQKSAQIFQEKRDEENFKKSIALVQSLQSSLNETATAGQPPAQGAIIDQKEISSNWDVHQDLVNDQDLNAPSTANRK